jgi:hypothetical protein
VWRDRLLYPILRHNLCALPYSAVQIEDTDFRQVLIVEIRAAFGIHRANVVALPVVLDAERSEKIFLPVCVNILSRFFLKDMA